MILKDPNEICKDCQKDCFLDGKDYFMVQHDIWKKYGVGLGLLCMSCMEERIGRKLIKDDILVCHVTTHWNPYTSKILKE